MEAFKDTVNIGKTLAQKLEQAGIESPAALREIGSREAFMKILIIDPGACIDMLYALEGAVRGIRWHSIPREDKDSLKTFFDSVSKTK